jgi:hypothetical protein
MSGRRGLLIGVVVITALGIVAITAIRRYKQPLVVRGAVLQSSDDSYKQSPIADVRVIADDDLSAAESRTDFSGSFSLTLHPWVRSGQPIALSFHHPDYQPLELRGIAGKQLFIAHLTPAHSEAETKTETPVSHSEVVVTNVVVRYSVETTSAENIGSGVKIFQISNTGNVLCNHAHVCSPDGKWRAAVGSATLDAGIGSEFRNARVSCIAGPCPFTKIDSDGFSAGGRNISVSIRDWSDSTTFVLQAEAFRIQVLDLVRQYYPIIIGRTLNFSLPAGATGTSVEAEVNGTEIDFALGPKPVLSWADCSVSTTRERASTYRCELKSWCRFH